MLAYPQKVDGVIMFNIVTNINFSHIQHHFMQKHRDHMQKTQEK